MSSSSHPTCGEEQAVDNLAAARDEAATSFLLLRLQWRCTKGSLKQIRRPRASLALHAPSWCRGTPWKNHNKDVVLATVLSYDPKLKIDGAEIKMHFGQCNTTLAKTKDLVQSRKNYNTND
uniref:Uncharacterized protein n=1 Tax=Aegilops tauschii TaxID=37682 RepID=M8APU7_AEGTA